MTVRRRQFFEFCDQPLLPGFLRSGFQDSLRLLHRTFQPYWHLYRHIAVWGANKRIMDMASGSGEQVAELLRKSIREGCSPPSFILTDLFPDIEAYKKLSAELGSQVLGFSTSPVSVNSVGNSKERYLSIFSSFHHFSPDEAAKLIHTAAANADGLCIAEITRRNLFYALMMPLSIPLYMLVPLFSGRITPLNFIFSTIIPLIPLIVVFDAIVSVFRSYTKEEIEGLFPPGLLNEFKIEYHEATWRFLPVKASVFLMTRKHTAENSNA